MARTTRTTSEEQDPRLKRSVEDAREELQERARLGNELIAAANAATFTASEGVQALRARRHTWTEYNQELIRSLFANPDRILREYRGGLRMAFAGGGPDPLHVQVAQLRDATQRDIRRLESIVERLPLFGSDVAGPAAKPAATPSSAARRVFVVHGHDEGTRLAVARFLEATATNFTVQVLSEALTAAAPSSRSSRVRPARPPSRWCCSPLTMKAGRALATSDTHGLVRT